MQPLPLVIAPDPVFRKQALPVVVVDDEIRSTINSMFDTLYQERGVGLGANMVGLLKRIIIVDLQENSVQSPQAFINPELLWASDETQTFSEGSLSFPGISADITRPSSIRITYLDEEGVRRELEASGWLATVIQHEMDYLDGRTFLDHLSKLKRDMLLKKMMKHPSFILRQGTET